MMTRRLMTILATAVMTSSLFSVAAMASGGDHPGLGGNRVQVLGDQYGMFAGNSALHGLDMHDPSLHCYAQNEISKYPLWLEPCSDSQ